jgi:hypothetical protein
MLMAVRNDVQKWFRLIKKHYKKVKAILIKTCVNSMNYKFDDTFINTACNGFCNLLNLLPHWTVAVMSELPCQPAADW